MTATEQLGEMQRTLELRYVRPYERSHAALTLVVHVRDQRQLISYRKVF